MASEAIKEIAIMEKIFMLNKRLFDPSILFNSLYPPLWTQLRFESTLSFRSFARDLIAENGK